MAKSYSSGDGSDAAIQISLSVLADDPTGSSISDSVVAAAAVRNNCSVLAPNGSGAAGGGSTYEQATNGKAGGRKVAMLECQCCFVEYSFEDMVSCRDQGHLFCKSCLQRHTEQRIFGIGNFGKSKSSDEHNNSNLTSNVAAPPNAHEILCMHSSGCFSGFPESQLRRALDAKVMKKYDELQYMAVIEKASSTDASKFPKCPKCQYVAFAEESIELLPFFHCPQCRFKSCRKCCEEYHPNITCEEVETKQETSGRTSVEEAMTMAKIRTCPKPFCRKKFLKLDGCNKMSCSCGAFLCYVCRQEIPKSVGYKHFCQTPHCKHENCNKCPLYSTEEKVEEEDKRKVREAAMRAAREVEEKSGGSGRKEKNGGAGNERKQQVRIDVESLLKDPPAQWGRNRKKK